MSASWDSTVKLSELQGQVTSHRGGECEIYLMEVSKWEILCLTRTLRFCRIDDLGGATGWCALGGDSLMFAPSTSAWLGRLLLSLPRTESLPVGNDRRSVLC